METSALPVVDEQIPYMDNKFPIPIDLFVSKKLSKGFRSNSYIRFTDSFGNLVFKSERGTQYQELKSTDTSHSFKVVVDSSGNALVSIHKIKEGLFNGYRLKDGREELMWRARKTVNQFAKTDFEVSLLGENIEDSETILKMKGCPFKRSCTIYKGDAILAQTAEDAAMFSNWVWLLEVDVDVNHICYLPSPIYASTSSISNLPTLNTWQHMVSMLRQKEISQS